jgi:hypothetical protein
MHITLGLLGAAGRSAGTVTALLVAPVVVVGTAAYAGGGWTPPPDTITRVTGNRHDGFRIEHYDGTVLHPPTLSEVLAECGEYDTRLARVRCRVHVRTWYRDLGDTKRALRLARRGG